ncbi:MAG: DUF2062 domain-containing protein [Chryseobacterium sp.]|nr:DUF2062 domain-containing protein [Chryseobacterium sp.]
MKNFIKNTYQSQKVFSRYIRKKGFRRFLKENILESDGSNRTKSLSVALGVFVGLTPFWGFHTVIVLFLATYFKLNKVLSYMSTHISFPLFLPFIIAISLFIGGHFVGENTKFASDDMNFEFVKEHLLQYIIGSSILAVFASILFGLITYLFLQKFGSKN